MLKYLIPDIKKQYLGTIFLCGLCGAIVSGIYGCIHDQITFLISNEYFTKVKFQQFNYLEFGINQHIQVGLIGFIAASWVGFFAGWFLARIAVLKIERPRAKSMIIRCFLQMAAYSLLFESIVYFIGMFCLNVLSLGLWSKTLMYYNIVDSEKFLLVVYMHYAAYFGAFLGFVISAFKIANLKST